MTGARSDLPMYVVYRNPSDFPDKYVVRVHTVATGSVVIASEPTVVADSLDEARRVIPFGSYNIGRYDQDDPVIFEVWV